MGTSACWNEPCGSDKRLLPLPFFFSFLLRSLQRLLLFFSGHIYIFITFVEKVVYSTGISGYYAKGQDGHILWPHQSELYLTVWQFIVPSFPFPKLLSSFCLPPSGLFVWEVPNAVEERSGSFLTYRSLKHIYYVLYRLLFRRGLFIPSTYLIELFQVVQLTDELKLPQKHQWVQKKKL